jgi:homoserine O-succinyltransferase
LRHERDTYPAAPAGYFDSKAQKSLTDFRQRAIADRSEELMTEFPEAPLTSGLQREWHKSAVNIYGNWLALIAEKKAEAFSFSSAGVRRSGNTLQWME